MVKVEIRIADSKSRTSSKLKPITSSKLKIITNVPRNSTIRTKLKPVLID